jgi:hypothetical protein
MMIVRALPEPAKHPPRQMYRLAVVHVGALRAGDEVCCLLAGALASGYDGAR